MFGDCLETLVYEARGPVTAGLGADGESDVHCKIFAQSPSFDEQRGMSKSWLTRERGRSSSRAAVQALVLGLAGCQSPAGNSAPPPAWPEEEPPEYPGVSAPPSGPAPASPAPGASQSPWAASHAGRASLDRFTGDATYYADSLAGNKTASGERYQPGAFTAAHRTLPFGTVVRVVRTDTCDGARCERVTYVKVNDRGPFGNANRVIDLSRAAATELEMLRAGVVPVRVEILELPPK